MVQVLHEHYLVIRECKMNQLSHKFVTDPNLDSLQVLNHSQRPRFRRHAEFFDEDYFIKGKLSGKSLYENYRWLPHLTKPMAKALIRFNNLQKTAKVLDFGCARGFLVRALTEEGIETYGTDISEYAIANSDPLIRDKLSLFTKNTFEPNLNRKKYGGIDLMIAKDVFEHIHPKDLYEILASAATFIKRAYILVPLGDKGKYRIGDYENDASHVIAENEKWWEDLFKACGFFVEQFRYRVDGIKEQALPLHPEGNGHFILKTL